MRLAAHADPGDSLCAYRRVISKGVVTTTYGYDINDERVLMGSTIYPFTLYNTQGSTSTITKHIFANGEPVADIQGSGASTSVYYLHGDNLNSVNVISNSSANVDQVYSYYPYGAQRIAETNGSFTEQRQYIGDEYDQGTSLNYLNARYLNSSQGQFLSEDPVFWGDPRQQNLRDPQSINTYSYSVDNPVTKKDPSGLQCVYCAGGEVGFSLSAQAAFDKAFGPSSSAVYGGDVVASSLYGFGYPWTLVAPEPVAAVSAAAGNITQQGLEYVSGDRTSFDPLQVRAAATEAFGIQLAVGPLPIPFISSSLEKQMATKIQRGVISQVSNATLGKIMTSGAPKDFAGNFAASYVQTQFSPSNYNLNSARGISTALSMNSPSLSTTITLAKAAISLAQSVIASHSNSR
jgi:RHS repeat-associated protein